MPLSRRAFVRLSGATMALGALGRPWSDPVGVLLGSADERGPLYRPPVLGVRDRVLTARAATAEIAPGILSPVMTLGDGPVAPTLRAARGERATITLRNALDEPTILHWHGFRPPQEVDGHPRFAIPGGAQFDYDFVIDEPPGLYWYHPHPHMRTAAQVHLGMAGLFVVTDPSEARLGLPHEDDTLLLVLQDKRPDAQGHISYSVTMGHDMMEGLLGSTPYVNGVRAPRAEVPRGLTRLRILGASNARIFRIALSDGRPLHLIGTDGGYLERPVACPWIDVSTGERIDVLVDFSDVAQGSSLMLQSQAFDSPYRGMGGGMGMGGGGMGGGMGMGGRVPNGAPMDLLELAVTRAPRERTRIPTALGTLPPRRDTPPATVREFRFASARMQHSINGGMFEMDRIDVRVPFGATERWVFINEGPFPHPVHMHAVHFRVVGREGGRGQLFPWEQGWKDTVLVYPGERVAVDATFDRHRGLFLMHCHNLEHEDHGMMMNVAVE
jgi:FtsP/CotA-like multicopper oxidase with cupredoxin domain